MGVANKSKRGTPEGASAKSPAALSGHWDRKVQKAPDKTSRPVSIPNANQESTMYANQYEEHLASQPDNSRWDGFNRGDADWNYDEEQRARNEADEAELRAEGLL
jgi:hypothetical protein